MSEETLSSPKQIYVDDESVDKCETMVEQSNFILYEIALKLCLHEHFLYYLC